MRRHDGGVAGVPVEADNTAECMPVRRHGGRKKPLRYTLNERTIERMLAQGTFLVPTYGTVLQIGRLGEQDPSWKDRLPVIQHRIDNAARSFKLACEAGVPFAVGTDGSNRPLLYVGEVLTEFLALLRIGLSRMEALQDATINGARALGWDDRLGTIEAGKLADITVLNGNPLEEPNALGDVHMAIKHGAVVVAGGRIIE